MFICVTPKESRYSPPWSDIFCVKQTSFISPAFTGSKNAFSNIVFVPVISVPLAVLNEKAKIGAGRFCRDNS